MTPQKKGQSDYSISVSIQADAGKVFEALSGGISDWWGYMDQPVKKKGDIFTVSWGEPWYRFRVMEFKPNEKIYWECMDANQIIGDMKGVQKEWVGTKLLWTIEPINAKEVTVTLIHRGLVPEFNCYDFCSSTWDRFIGDRLKKYLED